MLNIVNKDQFYLVSSIMSNDGHVFDVYVITNRANNFIFTTIKFMDLYGRRHSAFDDLGFNKEDGYFVLKFPSPRQYNSRRQVILE